MMISGITFSKYSVRQGNAGRMVERKSTIFSFRKCKMKQAVSTIDTNSAEKMVYQSAVGLVMVCIIATSSILQSWNIIGSAQVGQITSFSGVRMDWQRPVGAHREMVTFRDKIYLGFFLSQIKL